MSKPINIKLFVFFLSMFIVFSYDSYSSENYSSNDGHQKKEEKIDPGEIIIDHVVDHYSWHIATIGETHISIPLPVILYSQERGLFCFMSSRFNHGHDTYKQFKIAQEGKNKGNIVEIDEAGNVKDQMLLDFSITKNVFAVFFSIVLLVFVFVKVANSYKKRRNKSPKGMQSLLEPLILFIRDDIAKGNIGEKYERFTPFLLTIFFFIFLNNLLGLIPIFPAGANVTGNITVTAALALFTLFMIFLNGNKSFWKETFNTTGIPWWLKFPVPLIPVIELAGIFIKPFVLMVRLFANISAGHIVLLGFFTLIFIFGNLSDAAGYGISVFSVFFGVFISILELLVAFIQAYVFTILSAIYLGMAVGEGH
jgi:F-type H+-transporting ATPase subunit a